jgi:hypothetical protein
MEIWDIPVIQYQQKKTAQDVDVYLTTDLKTMIICWMSNSTYKSAISDNLMTVVGQPALTRNIREWLTCSVFADLPPAKEI